MVGGGREAERVVLDSQAGLTQADGRQETQRRVGVRWFEPPISEIPQAQRPRFGSEEVDLAVLVPYERCPHALELQPNRRHRPPQERASGHGQLRAGDRQQGLTILPAHPDIPDPDLLIRTASELRVSDFLLWQISYSEIYVTPVCWPEFRRPQLMEALADYANRVRKYGGLVSDQPPPDPVPSQPVQERRA